jgi:methylenetetrahydrofolate reductase (NADPH)
MRANVPGVHVPGEVARRLRGVPADRVADEGVRITVEIIQQVLQIPGVRGIHVMAPGFERGIPQILDQAGMPRRDGPQAASSPAGGPADGPARQSAGCGGAAGAPGQRSGRAY